MSNIQRNLGLSRFTIGIYILILSLLLFGILLISYSAAETAFYFDFGNTDINAVTYIY